SARGSGQSSATRAKRAMAMPEVSRQSPGSDRDSVVAVARHPVCRRSNSVPTNSALPRLGAVGADTVLAAAGASVMEGDIGGAVAMLRQATADTTAPRPAARQLLAGLLYLDDDLPGARRELELAFREWREAGEPRRAALMASELGDLHTSGFGNRTAGQGWINRARRLLAPF